MPKRRTALEPSAGLRMEYTKEAAWYWYRAESKEENLESILHRTSAGIMAERLRAMGFEFPSDQEIYAYAKGKWPEHKLHDAPV